MNVRRTVSAALVILGFAFGFASGARADATPALDQRAIFEILCGGAPAANPRLQQHLWQVAGSLAAQRWTPPQVTIRFVVRATPR